MDSRLIGGVGGNIQPASFAVPNIPTKVEFRAPAPAPQIQGPTGGGDFEFAKPQAVDARLELIQRISVERFSYPLGDSRFTIFKDAKSGQYIVKYTSLKDGSVRQIPEPELLTDYAARGKGPAYTTLV